MSKLWNGRLARGTDTLADEFIAGLRFDVWLVSKTLRAAKHGRKGWWVRAC